METPSIRSADDLLGLLAEHRATHVTVATCDFQGQLRGKLVSRAKLVAALAHGHAMPLGMLAMDPGDALLPAAGLSDGADGYRDAPARILPETVRRMPWAAPGRDLLVLAEYAGDAEALCPRAIYRRAAAYAGRQRLTVHHGVELEWTLFDETPWSALEKGYRGLRPATPLSTHGVIARQGARSAFYDDLTDACGPLGIELESLHEEIGGGMLEAAIAHAPGAGVADAAAVLKTAVKVIARRHGQLACFMARWSDDHDGQGAHVHLSVTGPAGELLFHDAGAPARPSPVMLRFIAGLQRWLPELVVMCAPNVNSYKRFAPGRFAPVAMAWGIDNRTCAIRAIPGTPAGARVECRVPGADSNPYLSLAALVAAGVRGVVEGASPLPPLEGDAYRRTTPPELALPATLGEAVARFRASAFAREVFGEAFVEAYAATRAAQERELAARVTDVELARFFELV